MSTETDSEDVVATPLPGEGCAWDRQLQADVAAGRLDALAEEALADLRAGRTWPICNERLTAAARHLLP